MRTGQIEGLAAFNAAGTILLAYRQQGCHLVQGMGTSAAAVCLQELP